MPAGTMPCAPPASATRSHRRAPCSSGTYSSQPRSPTYEMREAEALVRDVVARHAREDIACPRPPETERRPAAREVDELCGAVLRQVVEQPLPVAHAVRAAGD